MTRHFARAAACAALVMPFDGALSADPPKSGEQVYQAVCIACHEKGVAHAPAFGDREAWAERISEGQRELTAEAWVGVRAMPPRGGSTDLTLAEFARGVAYMANRAGAQWPDPDAAQLARIGREAAKRIDARIVELKQMKRGLVGLR